MTKDTMHNKLNQAVNGVNIEPERSFGPFIGILIIVALIIVGGLYFWQTLSSKISPVMLTTPTEQAQISNPAGTSPSFEVIDTVTTDTPTIEMTDAEFEALINGSTDTATLNAATDDMPDLDSLDAELNALELNL